jgi:hypothetical protein
VIIAPTLAMHRRRSVCQHPVDGVAG